VPVRRAGDRSGDRVDVCGVVRAVRVPVPARCDRARRALVSAEPSPHGHDPVIETPAATVGAASPRNPRRSSSRHTWTSHHDAASAEQRITYTETGLFALYAIELR
jgi:hypothetical protein